MSAPVWASPFKPQSRLPPCRRRLSGCGEFSTLAPRGRVKLKLAVAEPEPGEPANILKPLGYAEFRASGTVGDDTESLWVWALDDPVTLWVEGADNVRLR